MSRIPPLSGKNGNGNHAPGSKAPGPIVVIGSMNMDLVCRTPHLPAGGETVLGTDFVISPGGKGANQAVAAAKLATSTQVHLIARVGADDFGQRLLNCLANHDVKTTYVTVTEGVSSGVAMILVDKTGENSIVVAPGANALLTPADVDAAESVIRTASVVVLQLEIPLKTVIHAIALCQRLGVFTILDPAPAPAEGLPPEAYQVDIITPNQTEAEMLLSAQRTMGRMKRAKRVDAKQIGTDLLELGPKQVVLKLGARGAMVVDHEVLMANGYKANVVDTTAAGDAFTGALAVAKAEGMPINQAVKFANAAGALCCGGFGAQPALPTRAAVEKLLLED